MNFDYYIDEGVDRLFRYAHATGQQDRWNETSGTWTNVAPALVDNIYSGKVGLDEVAADRAALDYPRAFGDSPLPTEEAMNPLQTPIAEKTPSEELSHLNEAKPNPPKESGGRVFLTADMMDTIQVQIICKTSVEDFISNNSIPEAAQAEVRTFYTDLQKEMSETKLEPGQYWALPS